MKCEEGEDRGMATGAAIFLQPEIEISENPIAKPLIKKEKLNKDSKKVSKNRYLVISTGELLVIPINTDEETTVASAKLDSLKADGQLKAITFDGVIGQIIPPQPKFVIRFGNDSSALFNLGGLKVLPADPDQVVATLTGE
jgi:hypothetical protein